MKKELIYQLVMAHYKKDEKLFKQATIEIASVFRKENSERIANNMIAFLDGAAPIVYQDFPMPELEFLKKLTLNNEKIYLPKKIKSSIEKILKILLMRKKEFSKFLFYGKSGTGKTETINFIARKLEKEVYIVKCVDLVDSYLGETPKNIMRLIKEIETIDKINRQSIVLIDEIDLIAMDRVNSRDHREMGRTTTTFFNLLETKFENVIIFATTNLHKKMDNALLRRFDWNLSFDAYTNDDLLDLYKIFCMEYIENKSKIIENIINKIVLDVEKESPADIKRQIKIIKALSENENEFLINLYEKIYKIKPDLDNLQKFNLTTREKGMILNVSPTTISNKIKGI